MKKFLQIIINFLRKNKSISIMMGGTATAWLLMFMTVWVAYYLRGEVFRRCEELAVTFVFSMFVPTIVSIVVLFVLREACKKVE